MGMNLSKPPLCKGRCHGNAVTEGLLQSRGTTPQAAPGCFSVSLAKSSVFSRRRKTPRDATRLGQLTPCTGEPRSAPRRGLLLLLALAFLLASCTQAAPRAPQIPADFSAAVEVVRGDFAYRADYTRRGNAETLHITAPDSLAGLSAARTDGGCTLSVGDVTAAVPDDGIFAPFRLFDAPEGCLTGSREDGGLTVYAGSAGGDTYAVTVDGAGVPIRLSGSVGGCTAEIRVLQFAEIPPSAGEEGNAHE